MATYVLVHGAWHGAWCWFKVVLRLERAGHTVIALDLPGLGRDETPLTDVSLDTWTTRICQVLDDQSSPVILVGHSLGGTAISQAAERRPDAVRLSVYLAAFLLPNGQSARRMLQQDGTSLILQPGVMAADSVASTVTAGALRDVFYGECSDEDVALARLALRPQPHGPAGTPIAITENHFGRIPRFYVECLRDKAVPPSLQKRMYGAVSCQSVFRIDTDHSPFFSAPDELVALLTTVDTKGVNAIQLWHAVDGLRPQLHAGVGRLNSKRTTVGE